jgi:hypothetical protein
MEPKDIEQLLRNLPKAEPMTEEELARFEAFIDKLTFDLCEQRHKK